MAFQMLEVVDQDDPVPGGDPKHRQEPDQGAKGNHAACEPRRQDAAHQRRRKGEETERCQTPAVKRLLQKYEDDGERQHGEQFEPPAGGAQFLILALQHCVIAKWKRQLLQTRLHVPGNRAEIAAPDVRLHVDPTGASLTPDDIWRRPNTDIGYFSQLDALPGRSVDQHLADRVNAVAGFQRGPHLHVIGASADEDVADLGSGHQRRRGTPDITRLETVALRLVQLHRHLNVRHFDHQLLVQIDEVRNARERRANLLRLVPENIEIRAEDAYDDRLARSGQDLANALLQIGL